MEKVYWAGCNYWVNKGRVPEEPVGTALSMHDCVGCPDYTLCKLKQDTEVWPYNKEIAKQLDRDWRELQLAIHSPILNPKQ